MLEKDLILTCNKCTPNKILHDNSEWDKLIDSLNSIGDDIFDDPYGGYYPPAINPNNETEELNKRKKEGLCPTCGNKGRFSQFALYCDNCKRTY